MFNIGIGEMTLILVAALLVMGPDRLPEFARTLGKFLREFRRQTDDVRGVVMREIYKLEQEVDLEDRNPKKPRSLPTPAPELSTLPSAEVSPAGALATAAQAVEPSPAVPPAEPASAAAPEADDPNVTVVDGIRIAPASGTVARGSLRPQAAVSPDAAATPVVAVPAASPEASPDASGPSSTSQN